MLLTSPWEGESVGGVTSNVYVGVNIGTRMRLKHTQAAVVSLISNYDLYVIAYWFMLILPKGR
jgi:hypothetical protein